MRRVPPATVPIATIGAIALLRAEGVPFAAAATSAALVFGLALLAGAQAGGNARRSAAVLLWLATATAAAGLAPELFPCDVACRAGADWATLFGVPTLAWSAGATLLAALLLLAGGAAPATALRALPGELATRLAAGASLWFLALAWQMRMPCRLCLAVHLPLLAAAALLGRGGASPAWLRGGALLIGALLTRQLFRIDLERATPQTPPVVAAPGDALPEAPAPAEAETAAVEGGAAATAPPATAAPPAAGLLARLDAARRFGPPGAALRVELVFAYNCGHCAENFAPLLDAVRSLCDAGQLEACVRLLHAKKDAASRTLSQLTFAAALDGRLRERATAIWTSYAAALAAGGKDAAKGDMQAAVGRWFARDARTLDALRAAAAVGDAAGAELAADFAAIAAHTATYERFLADEETALRTLVGEGELPWLFLVDPATGKVIERLKSGSTPAQLAAAARRRLR